MVNNLDVPPDNGMIDGTRDLLSRPGLLQYRRDSMSPEVHHRNMQNLKRIEIIQPTKEPKTTFNRDERYIEIANWKPVMNEGLKRLLGHNQASKKNLWANFTENSEKDKGGLSGLSGLNLLGDRKKSKDKLNTFSRKQSRMSLHGNEERQSGSRIASATSVQSKFVNQTLHFNLEVADSNGWCIVPPVQIRSSSAAPSLRNKTRLQNWQTQRLQEILTKAKVMSKDSGEIIKNSVDRKMYTRYYTENIPNAKTSKKQNRPNSILGKSSEITEENLENIILEKPVETEIKMRNLFLIELPDSSVLIFYPNGKKAISKASNGYISFYDDDLTNKFIGMANPGGYVSFNNPKFSISRVEITLENGANTRKWADRNGQSEVIQINDFMKIRLSSAQNYTLFFETQNDSFHINLALSNRPKSSSSPLITQLGFLKSNCSLFESSTAKEHFPVKEKDRQNRIFLMKKTFKRNHEHMLNLSRMLLREKKLTQKCLRQLVEVFRDQTFQRSGSAQPKSELRKTEIGGMRIKCTKMRSSMKGPFVSEPRPSSAFNFTEKMDAVPIITDDLLDIYLGGAKETEIQVLSIRKEGVLPSNANRTVESISRKKRTSSFCKKNIKIYVYSLSDADTICQTSILEERHNIQPGMIVFFIGKNLLFADWIFDGHGSSYSSFLRQTDKSFKDFQGGKIFPQDYFFENEDLTESPFRRAAWGGQIYRHVKEDAQRPDFLQTKTEFFHTTTALARLRLFQQNVNSQNMLS